MKKLLTSLAIIATAMLGVTACSGGATPVAQVETPAPAPAEHTEESGAGLDEATMQACLDIAGSFAEASTAMAQIATHGNVAPQEAVDMWSALVTALDSVANSSSNPEVKAAATAAHADFAALRDAMQKVYVDGDMSAMGDYATAAAAIQESYQALLNLCAP